MQELMMNFNELRAINEKYELDINDINVYLVDMQNFKVCTPIIGKFSTGKSALINDMLGCNKKVLKLREDINPETAVPTEITYGDNNTAILVRNDNSEEEINIDDFLEDKYSYDNLAAVKLNLNRDSLLEIPNVTVVDMPGFESDERSHDKAIDNYLHKSLAYVIAFPANDMVLRGTIINILKELNISDMPVCVVITKMDKEYSEEAFEKLKADLKKYLTNKEISFYKSCARKGTDAYNKFGSEEFKKFLLEIQDRAPEIFKRKYTGILIKEAQNTESYIVNKIKNSSLSESELIEKEEKLNNELESLKNKMELQNDRFNSDINSFGEVIRGSVLSSLHAEESSFVIKALNHQDINQDIQSNVRLAVTRCIKEKFEPKLKNHCEKLESIINSGNLTTGGFMVSNMDFNVNAGVLNSKTKNTLGGIGLGAIILGPLGALIGGVVGFFRGKKKEEEQREQAKARIRQELSGIFNNVASEVSAKVHMELMKIVTEVNTTVDGELSKRQEVLEKAIEDTRREKEEETSRKQIQLEEMNRDLDFVRGLINGR